MKFANSLKKRMPTGRHAVIEVPFLWLFLFFLLPFAIVLKISLAEADVAIPPYTEIFRLRGPAVAGAPQPWQLPDADR